MQCNVILYIRDFSFGNDENVCFARFLVNLIFSPKLGEMTREMFILTFIWESHVVVSAPQTQMTKLPASQKVNSFPIQEWFLQYASSFVDPSSGKYFSDVRFPAAQISAFPIICDDRFEFWFWTNLVWLFWTNLVWLFTKFCQIWWGGCQAQGHFWKAI